MTKIRRIRNGVWMSEKYHYKYLDLIRTIGVFLVMYGHLVTVAMYSPTIDVVISEDNNYMLPMLDSTKPAIDSLEILFGKFGGVQTAVVGVVIFFMLTGYLSVDSLKRYGGKEFIKNRIIRLFPGIWIATIIAILISFLTQHITFDMLQVIGQLFMLYPLIQVSAMFGVAWTLAVELFFYVVIAHFEEVSYKCIIIVNFFVAMATLILYKTQSSNMNQIIYYIKYIPIILIGAAIKICEDKIKKEKVIVIISSFIMAWGNLNLNKYLNGDETTYPQLMTGVMAGGIFLVIYWIFSKRKALDNKIPQIVVWISENSYLIYLLQIFVGFNAMLILKHCGIINNFVLVIVAAVANILVGWICHIMFETKLMTILKRHI